MRRCILQTLVCSMKLNSADLLFMSWPLIGSKVNMLRNDANKTFNNYDTYDGIFHTI
jgi:hypothetical protein